MRIASLFVNGLERIELEIVVLIEPAALEKFEWKASSSCQGKRVDGELHVGVSFLLRFRLVVEDGDVTVADLQEIDVAGDDVAFEIEIESSLPVVAEVLSGQKHRYFHSNCHGIVGQHEPLKCLVSLPVIG